MDGLFLCLKFLDMFFSAIHLQEAWKSANNMKNENLRGETIIHVYIEAITCDKRATSLLSLEMMC